MTPARSYRILVVEDEPAVADLLVALLRDEGYAVALARDGAAALAWLSDRHDAAERFELVLLDMMLPGIPGGRVLQHALTARPDLPIIALSADPHARSEGAALGAVATLGKPFDVGELLALVERYCAPPGR
ncbi:MAG TPA: response regulator [Chloroflexota bacterium]|nr:response regulator [Chloroflexota bacterium]